VARSRIELFKYAEHTIPTSTHHRAYWEALDAALPEELRARIEPGGDLRGLWEAEPGEMRPKPAKPAAKPATPAPAVTEWRTAVQALNLSQPDAVTCQAACIGMAAGDRDIAGIRRKLTAIGTAGDPAVMGRVIKGYGVPYRYEGNACLAEVREWLKAGELLITHGWFTRSGHVICLDGLRKVPRSTTRYDVNVKDPWSEFDGPTWSYPGTSRFYDGFYSETIIYAACVAGASRDDAARIYRAGKVDPNQRGMWVHRFPPR
jgi:hypothetical protein